ncbi:OLC1v1014659C1 [Oldenlandia corymbosa var. corymbosa]|nr:OLC1v1014659C1 [Oldenlandia corymbosa var. corymbosa]
MVLPVPRGNSALRLGNNASIRTTIQVTKGLFYSLTFGVSRTCAQDEKLNLSVIPNSEANDSAMLPMQTMYSTDGWDTFSWGFLAEASKVDIVFHHPQTDKYNPGCGPIIDLVALKAFPPHTRRQGIVKNGNFEEGPYVIPNTTWGVLIPSNIEDDHCPLVGWVVESLKAVRYIDSDHFAVPEGKRAVELVAGRESVIAQTLRSIPNTVYNLEFFVGDAKNLCEGSMLVEVFAGNSTFRVPYESKGKGGSKLVRLQFKAVSSRSKIRFLSSYYHMKSDFSGSLCGPVVDGVRIRVAPRA